jgi:hypothetical protein
MGRNRTGTSRGRTSLQIGTACIRRGRAAVNPARCFVPTQAAPGPSALVGGGTSTTGVRARAVTYFRMLPWRACLILILSRGEMTRAMALSCWACFTRMWPTESVSAPDWPGGKGAGGAVSRASTQGGRTAFKGERRSGLPPPPQAAAGHLHDLHDGLRAFAGRQAGHEAAQDHLLCTGQDLVVPHTAAGERSGGVCTALKPELNVPQGR